MLHAERHRSIFNGDIQLFEETGKMGVGDLVVNHKSRINENRMPVIVHGDGICVPSGIIVVFMAAHVAKPGTAGFFKMLPRHTPVIFDQKMALEIQKKAVTGHRAARKKVTRDPVIRPLVLKKIRETAVREDMNEHFSVFTEK